MACGGGLRDAVRGRGAQPRHHRQRSLEPAWQRWRADVAARGAGRNDRGVRPPHGSRRPVARAYRRTHGPVTRLTERDGADPVRMRGMSGRALSFGVMAEAYERFRPGYPVELFDMVTAYAGQPVRTALEIGAGTGKATRLFAQRGVTVTATEPDGGMLAELRRHVPGNVKTVQAAFEDLQPDESYGLVYAAAAL